VSARILATRGAMMVSHVSCLKLIARQYPLPDIDMEERPGQQTGCVKCSHVGPSGLPIGRWNPRTPGLYWRSPAVIRP
jgi:hypothetical protein